MTAQEYLAHKGLSVEDGYMTDTSTDTGEYLTQEEVCVLMEQYAKQRQGVVPHDTVVSKRFYVCEEIKDKNEMKVLSTEFKSWEDAHSFKKTMEKGMRYKKTTLLIINVC